MKSRRFWISVRSGGYAVFDAFEIARDGALGARVTRTFRTLKEAREALKKLESKRAKS